VEQIAGRAAAALAAIAGLVGYVLVIGGVVVWLRLEHDGLASEAVLAATPHDELFIYGLETILAWVVFLALGGAAFVAFSARSAGADVGAVAVGAFGGVATTAGIVKTFGDGEAWWVLAIVVGLAALVLPIATGETDRWPRVIRVLVAALLGAALASGVLWIYQNHSTFAILAVLLVVLSFVWIGWGLQRRLALGRDLDLELAAVPAGQRQFRERLWRRRTPHSWLVGIGSGALTAGLVAFAAVVVGGAAVAVQVDGKHAFNRTRITLQNGKCIAGFYITRNDTEVLIAGHFTQADADNGLKPSLVSIRRDDVAELQVRGPRRPLKPGAKAKPEDKTYLRHIKCDHALTKPTSGENSNDKAGTTGATGKGGTKGANGTNPTNGANGTN
jgi:hypothetical protein